MYGTTTAATTALLAAAGFDTTLAIHVAAKDAPAERQRILMTLATAFLDLDSAETGLHGALENIKGQVDREAKNLENGDRTTDMWIAQSAGKITEYSAKVNAAAEKITMLTWLLNGTTKG